MRVAQEIGRGIRHGKDGMFQHPEGKDVQSS